MSYKGMSKEKLIEKLYKKDKLIKSLKEGVERQKSIKETLKNGIGDSIIKDHEMMQNEYRELIETIPSAILEIDCKGEIKSLNKSTCKLFGFSKEELKGKKLIDLVVGDIKNCIDKHEELTLKGVAIITESGNKKPILLKSKSLNNTRNLIIMEDMSVIKIYKHSLDMFINLLLKANKLAKLGHWRYDYKEDNMHFSNEMYEILGIDKNKEVNLDTIQNQVLLEYKEERMKKLDKLLKHETETEINLRYDITTYNGKLKTVDEICIFDSSKNGKKYVFGIVNDITSRMLSIHEDLIYYKAMTILPTPVIMTNPDGFILHANKKSCDLTGYNYKELIGKKTSILKSGTQDKEFYNELWDTIRNGETWQGRMVNKKKNGEIYIESATITPIINEDGEILYFLKIAEDITEKIEEKKALERAKKKAEESDRLKSAFLANIGHEIKTPLNGILGFVDILGDQIKNPDQRKEIEIIKESSDRLLNLMNSIMEVSKIEAGQEGIKRTTFELGSAIRNIFESYSKKYKDISTKISIPKDNGLLITTDRYKFNDILNNLISNAFKFTKKGHVEVGYKITKEKIKIYVEDSGIGIPDKELKNIFKRFRQVDMSFTREFEGIGLGLAVVKELLDLLGGKIKVKSKKGKGTKFTIIFYKTVLVDQAHKFKKEKGKNYDKLKGKKILVVEDNRINYLYIKNILENQDIKVISARNGNEGVDLARRKLDIDVIIIDIQLPGIDGITVMKKIRKFNSKVPIVATTAFSSEEEKEKILSKGFNEHMSKPINKISLYEVLSKLL